MPFRDIVGHRRLTALLTRAVARQTLPPALLLAGPAGVGKRRTAVAIAETMNCLTPRVGRVPPESHSLEGGPAAAVGRVPPESHSLEGGPGDGVDACGTCAACRRIARGIHPDVLVLEPGDTGTIKIDQVRDVIDRAGYRPFEGRRRVVVIDDADALVDAAQNALLKTLEEPPSSSTFVLVSSMPDALLPTVRSRAPRLRFAPLAAADVASVLMRDHGWAEADARAAAAESDGSVGRALASQSVDLAAARAAAQHLLEQSARSADPARRLDAVKELTAKKATSAEEREQMAGCLRALASLLRDLAMLATSADRRTLANTDLEPVLARLAAAYDGRRTAAAFAAVDRALAALERNASPKVVADWLVLQL